MSGSNPILSTIGIESPADFAYQPYEAVHERLKEKRDRSPDALDEDAGGWSGIARRFIACAASSDSFSSSIREFGNSPGHVERQSQETDLLAFFVTGQAALESFCYAAYAIGAMINPNPFPLDNLKNITPMFASNAYAKAFNGEHLSNALEALIKDADYRTWKDVRNVLAHRSAPGRVFACGGSDDGSAVWKPYGIAINDATTPSRRAWLATTLRSLLDAADTFTQRHPV